MSEATDKPTSDPGSPRATAASRVEAIMAAVRSQILNGKYEPGDRLPSERELAERLGGSRPSVREALKRLEQAGLIAIHPGGARVLPLEQGGLGLLPHLLGSQRPDPELISQWLDVWELVLTGATRLAVERGTDAELSQARALLKRLAQPKLSDEEFLEVNDALTELVADASRNLVLRMLRNDIMAGFDAHRALRYRSRPPSGRLRAEVKRIDAAVAKRDALAASEAVRDAIRARRELEIAMVMDVLAKGGA